jgi:hypothetical protein
MSLLQCFRILAQHFGDADDGVERRAQLVAHIGEELDLCWLASASWRPFSSISWNSRAFWIARTQAVQQPDCHRAGIVVTPENVGATIAIEIARSRNHPVERHHAKTGSLDNFKSV